jgi:hypothetical protein
MYCPKRGVTGITQSPIKGKEGQDELGDACENIRLLYHSTAMPQVTPIQRRLSSTTVAAASAYNKDTTFSDKVFQSIGTGRWFSPATPVSSINKTDHHDKTEILLKVALHT